MKIFFIVNDLGVNEPFGPMLLSSIAKDNGHETTLGSIQLDKDNLTDKILSYRPDILAYSAMTVDMEDIKLFNKIIHEKISCFTILGGPATLDHNIIEDPFIDAICVGEGDEPFKEFLDKFMSNKNIDEIQNIITSNNKDRKLNLKHRIEKLDDIPFMDRDLVLKYPEMARFGIKGIWTNRGCAFSCPYCFNNRYNDMYKNKGKVVRKRSVSNIIEEAIEVKNNYKVDIFRIQDDIFVYRVDDWFEEFAERWPNEVGVPYYCLLRLELVTDELCKLLKKSGCHSVATSVEAADDDFRNRMLRRKMTREKMEESFILFKKHKLNVYNNIMFALPHSTIEDDIKSVDFAIKVQPDLPDFSIFMPYPGTDLGDYCIREGIYDHENENLYFGFRNESVLKCFDSRTKQAQYNLAQLAIVAVKLPILRNLIVNHLIFWKSNKTFFLVHYLFAIYGYGVKIFPYKHSVSDYLFLIKKTMKFYLYDFFGKVPNEKNIADNNLTEKLPVLARSSNPLIAKKIKQTNRNPSNKINVDEKISDLEKCLQAMKSLNSYAKRSELWKISS